MFAAYGLSKKWDLSFTVNGFLAGLVAITCPCYWVSPLGAILLGGVAGAVVVYGVELLEYLRIDDPIGAVSVAASAESGRIAGPLRQRRIRRHHRSVRGGQYHAAQGASLYGGGTRVLVAQAIGSAIITVSTFVVALALMVHGTTPCKSACGFLRKVRRKALTFTSTASPLIPST